jgi:hypothetical protein
MLLGTTLTSLEFLVGRMTRTSIFLFANVQEWSGKIPILHRLRLEFIFYRLFVYGPLHPDVIFRHTDGIDSDLNAPMIDNYPISAAIVIRVSLTAWRSEN